MTFIDVGYMCDVNTVTFINDERMEIVIFTLPINVNNKSHDYMAHFPSIQTCMLKNEIRCLCDSIVLRRCLIQRSYCGNV